jgi:hypothetical protein
VHAQADLFGSSFWPNALDQGSPSDDLVCLLRQDDQEIHGARAERDGLCAICQKSVPDRQFERAEAQHFAALITHGIFSSKLVLELTSSGVPRSRRQLAGLWPKACLKSLHRCAWSEKPTLKAISLSDAALVIIRWEALSRRLLTTKACGDSPTASLNLREKCAGLRRATALRSRM